MCWEKLAKAVEKEYGCQVDWDEEFFICPECGEPVYKAIGQILILRWAALSWKT